MLEEEGEAVASVRSFIRLRTTEAPESRFRTRLELADSKHDLAKHAPGGKALVRLCGVGERVNSCYRTFESRRHHGAFQALELFNAGVAS